MHKCVFLSSIDCNCIINVHVCVCSVPREQLLQTEEYDLNVVRLCIQVFLQDESGQYARALSPIVTNPIYDNSEWPSSVCVRADINVRQL